jgi:hypothetical protein
MWDEGKQIYLGYSPNPVSNAARLRDVSALQLLTARLPSAVSGYALEARAARAYDVMVIRCRGGANAVGEPPVNFAVTDYRTLFPAEGGGLFDVPKEQLVLSLRRHSKVRTNMPNREDFAPGRTKRGFLSGGVVRDEDVERGITFQPPPPQGGTAQDGHQLHCTVSDTNNNW